MTFYITADIRRRQETEQAETPHAALAWVWEFRERGATEVYIRDDRRLYTEKELNEMAGAQKS